MPDFSPTPPGPSPAEGFVIEPSDWVNQWLRLSRTAHTPDLAALGELAEMLHAPLPDEPILRLLGHDNVLDEGVLHVSKRAPYDPGNPEIFVGLQNRTDASLSDKLLPAIAEGLLYRKRAKERRLAGRIGYSLVGGSVAVVAAGGALEFSGHPLGSVIEKVGFGLFTAGGATVTWGHNRNDPKIPDLTNSRPPITTAAA